MEPNNTVLLRIRQVAAFIGLLGSVTIAYYLVRVELDWHNSTVNTLVGAFVAIATYYFIARRYPGFSVKFQIALLAASYVLFAGLFSFALKVLGAI